MNSNEGNAFSIDQVKVEVINTSLVVASILGGFAYTASLISRLQTGFLNISILFESIVLFSLLVITFRREKIGNSVKAYIIISLILFLSLTDALIYGLFSSTRVYLVLVPLYAIIYLPQRRSLIIYTLSIIAFVVIGFFHSNGILSVPQGYEPANYILRIFPWFINAIHISAIGLIILYVTLKFFRAFTGVINNLRLQNIKIAEKEKNYREIFNSTSEAIFIHDTQSGNILDVNDVMLKMFGFESKDEVLALSVRDLSGGDGQTVGNQAMEFIKKAVEEGAQVFEWVSKRKNGEIFYSEISLRSTQIGGEGRVLAVVRDVSERRRMEQSIQESEERYRTLVETSQDGISLMDITGVMLYVNNRKAELIGAKSAIELIGQNAFDLLTEESVDEVNSLMPKLISDGYIDKFEAEVRRLNGTIFSAEFNVTILKDSKGEAKYMMDTMRDITERKMNEKALIESQQLFQTLSQMSPVGIFRTNHQGHYTYVNPKWSELSGLSSEEALGEGWLLSVHPDDRESIESKWRICIAERTKFREEFRYLKKDGSLTWVMGIAVPDFVNNEFKGFIGTNTNVTKRTLAQLALKESEERYRTIIEAFPEIIMVSDLNGNIIMANNALEKITGITHDDYSNPNRKAQIHPDDKAFVIEEIKKLLSSESMHTPIIENRFIDAWGKTHWLSGIISKIYINNQLYLQTISRDITDKKRAEEELEKYRNHLEFLVQERTEELEAANEELHSTNEELYSQREELEAAINNLQTAQSKLIQSEKMASLGVLAAGVAHEINNPLNFIQGGALALETYTKENLGEKINDVKPYIEAINEGLTRAVNIVKGLNQYSQKSEKHAASCNLHSIINNCLLMLTNQMKGRITVEKDYTLDPFTISCNEGKMHQAILNILKNAVQSIENQGVIKIQTKKTAKNIQVTIIDTGCGISAENLLKIFDPFFTTKNPGEGTGLGLSITQNIVEEHGGTIEFESKLGKGTKVYLNLPLK